MILGYVLSGLVTGAIFAVMGSGLTLSYAATGVFNFAHGAVGFLTALVYYELNVALGLPTWVCAVVAVGIFAPLLGYFLHRVMFRGLAQAGETAQIVGTIGLTIALPATGLLLVDLLELPSADATSLPRGLGPFPATSFTVLGVPLDSGQLITFAFAAVAALGLWAFMRHTPYGLRMRASVDRRRLATLRGIDADATSGLAWMLGSGLAGLAGVLAVSIIGLDATAYTVLLFASATAAVFGRLRSIPWTFAAGLGLGVVQNLVAGYTDFLSEITGLRTAVPVLLLFAGLILLNRSRERVAGSAAEDAPPPDYLAGIPAWRRRLPWAVSLAVLVVFTFTAQEYYVGIAAHGLVLALIFCSFVVVTGIGGMVNLAQAAFASMAALTCGWAFASGLPFAVAIVLGVLAATAVGMLVALPALRLGGRILTLATLALALLADQVLFQVDAFSNGTIGWQLPALGFGFADTSDPRVRVVVLLLLIGLVALLVRNLERSASGRAILAVRSAPAAATTSGIAGPRTKIMLFALASGIAGLGGVLFAVSKGSITATDLPAFAGFVWLAVVVLQGVRRIGGAVLGGLIAAAFPEILSAWEISAHVGAILFGAGGVILAKHPDGILTQLAQTRHHHRHHSHPTPTHLPTHPTPTHLLTHPPDPTHPTPDPTHPTPAHLLSTSDLLPSTPTPPALTPPLPHIPITPTSSLSPTALDPAHTPTPTAHGPAHTPTPTAHGPAHTPTPATSASALPHPQTAPDTTSEPTAPTPAPAPATAPAPSAAAAAGSGTGAHGTHGTHGTTVGSSPASARTTAGAETPAARPGPAAAGAVAVPGPRSPGGPVGGAGEWDATPLFRLDNVVAGYADTTVLRGVDLEVHEGEVVALLGANGAGKSTACAVAAGDLPVGTGRVLLNGIDVTRWPAHRRVGEGILLAPEGRGVFPGLTVEENLRTWLPDPEAVYDRMPQLAARRTLAAGALSGGEQQLLTLAPALIKPPAVLIADEPSLGLAPLIVQQVFEIFAELSERGVALLLVEEKATEVLAVADRVAFMSLGRITWTGPCSEVDPTRLTATYLGAP
ncbi:ATP-binding cassette domain-containing protein [Nonomuraea sp. NPDC050540]|uniref:ABC transporter permease subunit n=1 Tax=Nonomuraea sp. NPDC050540 TaxID=3364367 RepID=UPI0037B427D8